MSNDLYQQALDAIQELFGDTSVSQQETLSLLDMLIDEIGTFIDAIENDLKSEK